VLKIFEFTSDRKMMTVVVEINSKVFAFVKGADTSVEPLCLLSKEDKVTLDDLDDFAEKGLRTLAYAYKEIHNFDNVEELTVKAVESNLTLLGVTGVEDLLQDDVEKCITDFKEAGCKVWILTGDKGATAYQIGISCGVLNPQLREVCQIESISDSTCSEILNDKNDLKDVLISG
jgi:magnesium-transporting ATPase (P-type)